MNTIRCAFVDLWEPFDPTSIPYLFENYHVVIDFDNPDYVFYSCFGHDHYKYNSCIKIFWCGENIEPNFNDCDYAISYSEIEYKGRSFRDYCNFQQEKPLPPLSPEELLNRKFCNFIYSNNSSSDPYRTLILQELSKYKKVDCGGPLFNNIGYCVPPTRQAKIDFQAQYKFSLAIENSSASGYTTEKIYHPFLAHSLPAYWGNPHIDSDYNPRAFINLMNYSCMEEAIEEIIRLDNDNEAYLEKVTAPFYLHGDSFEEFRRKEKERLLKFYASIFTIPLTEARRRTMYGRVKLYNRAQEELQHPFKLLVKRNYDKLRRLIHK